MSPSQYSHKLTVTQPLLDTLYRVETPEAIDLLLSPAGPVVRALAFAIDLLIRGTLIIGLYLVLSMLGDIGVGLSLMLMFIINWWYMVLFEVLNQGQSPGKYLMGLRVIHDDGTPIGWPASLTRNLLRVVDMLPMAYALGLTSTLLHGAFKRVGDIAAGTLVVYQPRPTPIVSLPEAEPLSPPFSLSLDEQRALVSFAERADGLSPERRLELAGLLSEALKVTPELAEKQLYGIARALSGTA